MAPSTHQHHPHALQRLRNRHLLPLQARAYHYRGPPSRVSCVYEIARAALKLFAGATVASSAVLALQLAWVVLRTPRLPPPPLSGEDFVRGGRVVGAEDIDDDASEDDVGTNGGEGEFRLVLVGDSPVEGIGNLHHDDTLGGQTARAFAKLLCRQTKEYDCVRYWCYGKSGLTARGIQEEMAVPFLHRVVDDVRLGAGKHNQVSSDRAVHAIIVLCGVNNVLDPVSTAESFYSEVLSLLKSIRNHPGVERTPLIVLGLPDFSKLPFLPWPLSLALGYRGRKMQRMLELAVKDQQKESGEIAIVNIPEVQQVLGSIGFHRYDSSQDDGGSDALAKGNSTAATRKLKMRLVHPLLKYLESNGKLLKQLGQGELEMKDFLCDDGFHPGRYGTVYIGNLIAESYGKLKRHG